MVNRQILSEKLLAYLNNEITLAELVDWAEVFFIDGWFEPDEDIPLLRDIMMFIAGADTPYCPLTWGVCQDFMQRLGSPVKVVLADKAS